MLYRRPHPLTKPFLFLAGTATLAGALAAAPALKGGQARTLLDELKVKAEQQPALASVVTEVEGALARSKELSEHPDAERKRAQAQRLDAIALEWAELGRDLDRATALEAEALAQEAELTDVETKLVRAQALLEETWARRGRAETALKRLSGSSTDTSEGNTDAPASEPAGTPGGTQ